jgi:cytoskeletal protein CcmA (bactofilin family)
MLRLLKFLAMTLFVLIVLGSIFIGGLFVGHGTQVAWLLDELGVRPPPAIRPAVPAAEWVEVRVPVGTRHMGALDGQVVIVYEEARVLGPVTALQRVSVYGTVMGDVRAPAVEIGADTRRPGGGTVHGSVDGGAVSIGVAAQVTGPVRAGELVEVAGSVRGNVTAPLIFIRRTARIEGDLNAAGGSILVEEGAVITGSRSGAIISINPGVPPAAVASVPAALPPGVRHSAQPVSPVGPLQPARYVPAGHGWPSGSGLGMALGLGALAALALVFAPGEVEQVSSAVERRPSRSLLLGIWSAVLVGAGMLVLAVTVVGAVALGIAAVAAAVVGGAAISEVVGRRLVTAAGRQQPPVINAAVGAVCIGLLAFVPVAGPLLMGAGLLAGFGATAAFWYPRLREWWRSRGRRQEPLTPETAPAAPGEAPEQKPEA